MRNAPAQTLVPGILGGMGPLAHIELERRMLRVGAEFGARTDQEHPMWILVSATHTPDRTLSLHGRADGSGDWIELYANLLEHAGADFIVVACNTAHAFFDDIAPRLGIPWIHMIDAVAAHIHERYTGIKIVGVLQTDGCGKSGLYRDRLQSRGLGFVSPYATDDRAQSRVMDIAYEPDWGVKATGDAVSQSAIERLSEGIDWLHAHGAQVAIVGCTEFSAAAAHLGKTPIPVVDPLDVLARVTVELAMGIRPLGVPA
jgi:aspartate racemase